MEEFIANILKQLEPVIGLLIAILLVAVIYLWRRLAEKDHEIERLRAERNEVAEKKDEDLKEIAAHKDLELKEMTEKVIELQEKTIVSNEKLANNIQVNTEATKRMEMLISNFNAVLTSVKN